MAALPTSGGDIEAQAQSVLALVLGPVAAGRVVHLDPGTCPNCGALVESTKSPYCGEGCREAAGFVRQFRTGLKLGWIFEKDKQIALGQVLWHVLGGGRPLRREISPAKARQKAIQREGGKCQVCGGQATTVDHVGSGCNRPINLRAVCEECCQDRPFFDAKVLEASSESVVDLSSRIQSIQPLRCCDDADTWDWRGYVKLRHRAGGLQSA